MVKEKGSIKIIIIAVFIIAVLVIAGYLGYKYYIGLEKENQANDQNLIVGGDRDEHGCIGSAGYSWCEKKNKCLRIWEERCEILGDIYPTFSDLKWSDVSAKTIAEPVTDIAISGYEITTQGQINNNVDASKFFNYYKKLTNSGWTVDNYFAADGILGSQMGYKKDNNYIVLNYSITPGTVTSGANEPLQWICPCSVKYTIFTGSSENLIKNTK